MSYFFTSESVSEGHPDKMADQISDAILDAILAQDPTARVACETMLSTGLCVIAGEITTNAQVNFHEVARKTITEIGYDDSAKGFDGNTCAVMVALGKQSPDIAQGVGKTMSDEQGAGDQGIMFGYACDETEEAMPLSIDLSHKILLELSQARKTNKVSWLRPDSKSQVTIEYNEQGQAQRVDAIVVSTQHSPDVSQKEIHEFVIEQIIKKVVPAHWIDNKTRFHINPTGRFVVGGPMGDAGLTGRKIIVDTYGGHGAHGGGAFSGKDPSKVDRSAAYATRHIAKNIVKAGLAKKCLVQVAYAIGVAEPVSIFVNDYGTSPVGPRALEKAIRELWDLRPGRILKEYELLRPIYKATAAYGHFGRSQFPWEKTNKVEQLRSFVQSL
jgi:S-adenosylmethionine synthetase